MSHNSKRRLSAWLRDKKNLKNILIPTLVIIALFIAGRLIDLQNYLEAVQDWIWGLGPWGPVVYGTLYVICMLLLMPGMPFTVIAAFLFGPLWGYVTMLTATTAAAIIMFVIARYLAKEKIDKRLADLDGFQKVKDWVRANEWLAIPFIRIVPIFPFAMNNYALGLTNVSFWIYLLISELVFIPMTAIFIFGAQALYSAMVQGEISWPMLAGTFGAGIIVLVLGFAGKKAFAHAGSQTELQAGTASSGGGQADRQ